MRLATGLCVAMLAAWTSGEARGDSPGVGEWKQRLESDKSAERGQARRELRRLAPDESDVLAELARDEDVNVRVAAIDVLTSWLRGDDETRRAAARGAMRELSRSSEPAAALAAARLDGIERGEEREALAEILRPVKRALIFT
ncbi:MAG: hypothetical protein WD875_10250 [Pirellulales bacterium]